MQKAEALSDLTQLKCVNHCEDVKIGFAHSVYVAPPLQLPHELGNRNWSFLLTKHMQFGSKQFPRFKAALVMDFLSFCYGSNAFFSKTLIVSRAKFHRE